MNFSTSANSSSDKRLFTPGPLTTSATVKQAMQRDLGSRDREFLDIVAEIRSELLRLGGVRPEEYTVVLVQGSGTFGLESVITSAVPYDGKLLVAINGAYGRRLADIAQAARIETITVSFPEDEPIDPQAVASALANDPHIAMTAIVHCETTTGLLNPISAIASVASRAGSRVLVDAMSSFGALPIDIAGLGIDYLVSSANKCIEGVPGFSFAVARLSALQECRGRARSLCLDLFAQWRGLESDGQFRFTPPTHAILAFRQALRELEEEGGVEARGRRYRANHDVIVEEMRSMGFEPYLRPEIQAPIITAFRYPDHPGFDFKTFYQRLSDRGHLIYPGKLSQVPCFRIGNIGRLYPDDMRSLADAIREALREMQVIA